MTLHTDQQTGITGSTSHLVAQVARAHRKRAAALLDEVGLHLGQEMILEALWTEGTLTQSELADRLGIRNATVTVALKSMERECLIERARDRDDRRVIHVRTAEKCKELRPRVYEVWRRLDAQTVAGLNSNEQITLRRLLRKVRSSLQDVK